MEGIVRTTKSELLAVWDASSAGVHGLLGIPLLCTYFFGDIAQDFPTTAVSILLVKSGNISPQEMITLTTLEFLPWTCRLVIGMLFDAFPLWGYHKRSYLLLSLSVLMPLYAAVAFVPYTNFALVTAVLMGVATCHCAVEVCLDGIAVAQGNSLSNLLQQVYNLDAVQHEPDDKQSLIDRQSSGYGGIRNASTVQQSAADAAVSEASTTSLLLDPVLLADMQIAAEKMPARVQATTMVVRSSASVAAAAFGLIAALWLSPQMIIFTNVFFVACTLTFAMGIPEPVTQKVSSALNCWRKRHDRLYQQRCRRAILRLVRVMAGPLLLVVLYDVAPSYSEVYYTWVYYQPFTPFQYQLLNFATLAASLFGAIIYRFIHSRVPLRPLFVVALLLSMGSSWFAWMYATNKYTQTGISGINFLVLTEVMTGIFSRLAFMPVLTVAAQSCPAGIEAATYSAFLTFDNLAGLVSGPLAAAIARGTHTTLESNFAHLGEYVWVCTCVGGIALLALPFVRSNPAPVHPDLRFFLAEGKGHVGGYGDDERGDDVGGSNADDSDGYLDDTP